MEMTMQLALYSDTYNFQSDMQCLPDFVTRESRNCCLNSKTKRARWLPHNTREKNENLIKSPTWEEFRGHVGVI